MSLQAACPACGGAVEWKLGDSLVVVCSYCHSAIARADRTLSDLGKVADLAETGSLLQLGIAGVYKGVHFRLVGHGQMAHPAGGRWDEWYAAFSDGRWGWLAEAQGQLYLTFRGHAHALPALAALEIGTRAFDDFVTAEKGRARALGAEGELPFAWTRDALWDYADLSGPSGVFGTIDYSEEPPIFFIGRQVTLDELGIPVSARRVPPDPGKVKALELACPNCHGPLPLRAPDASLRVTCPSCDGLLDVTDGKLSYPRALAKPDFAPCLKLGSVGTLGGHKYTVLGYLRRGVTVDGVVYKWSEYLLWEPRIGFRWIVESTGHWCFVEPVPAGDVGQPGARHKKYRDTQFQIFQAGSAEVLHVLGEFYWRVEVGEQVKSYDYIAPPLMLSAECTEAEVNWSLGTYTPPAEIQRAFAGVALPPVAGIGAAQPLPHTGVIRLWPKMLLLALVVWVGILATRQQRVVFEQTYTLDNAATTAPVVPAAEPSAPAADAPTPAEVDEAAKVSTLVFFSDPVTLAANQPIDVSLETTVTNSWIGLEGDVIDEQTNEVSSFAIPIEYYTGVDDGESWSEGSRDGSARLPSLRAGVHTLRFEIQWERAAPTRIATVRVRQGYASWLQFLLVLLAISLFPILVWLRRNQLEQRRWEDADFTPDGSPRTGDDE